MENNEKKASKLKLLLNNFELYAGTLCFIIVTILLTLQVVSRYAFNHSFTWMEEFATMLFVWMSYFGISAAIDKRKHLRIDFILEMVPFKVKRVMLILCNVIFMAFCVYMTVVMIQLMEIALAGSKSPMLRIPYTIVYAIIPFNMVVSLIRLVQDTIRLTKESKENLGAAKPSLDLDACEERYRQKLAAKAALEAEKKGENA